MCHIQESGITNKSVSGDRGAYGFLKRSFPKGALTHHRQSRRCTACGRRALYEVMRRRDTPIFLQSLHKKGSDRLSPYIILKQKSSPVVQVALQWRQPPI